jgi:hypothetical protein
MAIYKIYPEKDATMYTQYPSMNTGLDEILEASTYLEDTKGQTSRYLIKFSQNEIENVFDTYISNSQTGLNRNFSTYFKNYAAIVTNLNENVKLELYPLAQSWNMGTGRFENSPQTENGVSWGFTDKSGSIKWTQSSWNPRITASFKRTQTIPPVDVEKGGGTWYTGSISLKSITSSQILNYSDPIDLEMDTTNIVKEWISQSKGILHNGIPLEIINQGFIIKQTSSLEFYPSQSAASTIKYYSIDTNTIYPPHLEFRFDDYIFNTGSSTNVILNSDEAFMSIFNNKDKYYSGSIERFRLAAIPKYPTRTFTTSSNYLINNYLPTSSYYAIKDSQTNEYIINFDNTYTKISADEISSYFDIYMNGLEPERYYTILIKVKSNNSTKIFDENMNFKVING